MHEQRGTTLTEEQRAQLSALFTMQAEAAYARHRLRYAHIEDDDKSITFVCICGEGFSQRRNWNLHIKDSFTEIF